MGPGNNRNFPLMIRISAAEYVSVVVFGYVQCFLSSNIERNNEVSGQLESRILNHFFWLDLPYGVFTLNETETDSETD